MSGSDVQGAFAGSRAAVWNWWIVRVTFCAGIAAFVCLLLTLAGARIGFVSAFEVLWGVWVVLSAGELLLGIPGLQYPVASIPSAACVGVPLVSLLMLPFVWYGGIPAATVFGGLGICIVVLRVVLRGRVKSSTDATAYQDVLVSFTVALFVYWCCRSIAASLPDLSKDGVLHAWADYYIHGSQIAEFGDRLAVGRGNITMVGGPRTFYHYGVFMLPSALLPLSGLPGLGLATAILLPLGLLIGWIGVYVFCAELTGRLIGASSALTVGLLADPSSYWLRNGFLGFRWLLFAAPGSGYAIGIGAIALALIMNGVRSKKQTGSLIVGFCLISSLIMIRAHIFLIAAPAGLGMVFIRVRRLRSMRVVIPVIGLVTISMLAVTLSSIGHSLWQYEVDALLRFLDSVYRDMEPTAYPALGAPLVERYGRIVATPIQVAGVVVASLGAFAILFPLVCVIARKTQTLGGEHMLLALLIATYILLVLFAPVAANGDVSEYKQRHFVFLYAVVGAASIAMLIKGLRVEALAGTTGAASVLGGALCAAFVLASSGSQVDPGRPIFGWGAAFYNVPVDRCTVRLAEYIRTHARKEDVIALGGADVGTTLVDPATIIVSLSDVPAFLGRSALHLAQGGVGGREAVSRIATMREIDRALSPEQAMNLASRHNIGWYVRVDGKNPNWDSAGKASTFRCADNLVYKVSVK
ncbi:hypothetical protein [Paraburkholderia caribensis]|uniref:hypothetical protein n=1 Tax=Paraburkholderia caribensis TaxID=75105 RepID=UPI0015922525|nr:hypothetical protein [Paraburkholderia caribensis]